MSVHPTWVHVVCPSGAEESHTKSRIYTRVPKGSPLSPASKAGDTLTPSAARHSSKCRHRKPGPPSRSLTSTLPASTSTRFYSLTTSKTAIATSTSIFTTAPQTDHVPYSQKSNRRREDTAVRTTAHNYQAFATHRSHDRTNATTTLS